MDEHDNSDPGTPRKLKPLYKFCPKCGCEMNWVEFEVYKCDICKRWLCWGHFQYSAIQFLCFECHEKYFIQCEWCNEDILKHYKQCHSWLFDHRIHIHARCYLYNAFLCERCKIYTGEGANYVCEACYCTLVPTEKYEYRYPFILDDVFLTVKVNPLSGKQLIILQKINPTTNEVEFENKITCVHVAVTTINVEEFNELQDDSDKRGKFINDTLEIRSSENLEQINLSPEEKFFAMKSWAEGIVDAGFGVFRIQSTIDRFGNLAYPFIQGFLKFFINCDPEFILIYLDWMERECITNGIYHTSSLIANLNIILEAINHNYRVGRPIRSAIIERVLEINDSEEVQDFLQGNINWSA